MSQREPAGERASGARPALDRRPGYARVLLVEDEPDIADLVKLTLEREGRMEVETVADGEQAVRLAIDHPPDLLVLDLSLPGLDGLEVCRLIRANPVARQVPIIMLTARTDELDRISGLDLGADDYVTKPFSARELAARARAILRRQPSGGDQPIAVYRGRHLVADFDAVVVSVDGRPIRLTRREFELLRFLIGNRNRVLSRDRLLDRVWGYEQIIETRSVDVHIGRLRAKLGPAGKQVETVVGLGYRFVDA